MIKEIRTNKTSRFVALYLALTLLVEIVAPVKVYALTEGPSQPEFNSFTPIGTSDMVDLATGDLNYNIPIMDVGGYPLNLSYQSGVTMDQEASWVGLGWNLNIGQIERQIRGLPDDFKGDEILSVNNIRDNITIGVQGYVNTQIIGALDNLSAGAGLNIQYNNYTGLSAVPSYGISFKINDNVSVGMNMTSSTENGVSITPNASVKLSGILKNSDGAANILTSSISPGITYNSRQGLESFSLSGKIGMEKDGEKFRSDSETSSSVSFLTKTFTPTKRLAFKNNNVTFSFSTGPDCFGAHQEFSLTAYGSIQKLKDVTTKNEAYGYDYAELAGENDLLDFNREKEASTITKNTLVLPVTNQTYDLYSVRGQGISGQFRPYRGQIGYVRDAKVNDVSDSNSFGFEGEGGCGAHGGFNYKHTDANTYTGGWDANAVNYLKYKTSGNKIEYQPVHFKMVGEIKADREWGDIFESKLAGNVPVTLALDVNKSATNIYAKKEVASGGYASTLTAMAPFINPIKRDTREKRNTVVQKITKKEADNSIVGTSFIKTNSSAKPHHTAGYIITDESGSRHIYGETAYNKEKYEVSFAVNGSNGVDKPKGLVSYNSTLSSPNNSAGVDHYFNKQYTPPYAHTYLLTSLLSPDYEDVTGNGPSDDDMGTYTKFDYVTKSDYKWRTPYTKASYNEGLKTLKGNVGDDKGSYLYGVKEIKYVSKIITKTHVAFIDLEVRKDGYGVANESGGNVTTDAYSRMYSIKSIRLYSKPEITNTAGVIYDPLTAGPPYQSVKPIKTAYFEYDYSLCPGTENTFGVEGVNGKLTLKKLYFTYRGSNMGRFTQYRFNYDGLNPAYKMKEFDVWGNYKESLANSDFSDNNKKTSNQEFPYVNQNSSDINPLYSSKKHQQDTFAAAWSLTSVELPSGGIINFEYESDDYKYVQDKRAVQMFKVAGVSAQPTISSMEQLNCNLHSGIAEAKYVVIKLDAGDTDTNASNFKQRYIGEQAGQPIFFNFLLNMTASDYEYIEGYFKMDGEAQFVQSGSDKYIFVPMDYTNMEGKIGGTKNANPISVAGWFFGRKHLNRQVNQVWTGVGWSDALNVVEVGKELVDNMSTAFTLFQGGNKRLSELDCANNFKKDKSWIRLQEPTARKLGGGLRVKKVIMKDGWDVMLGVSPGSPDIDRYKKEYGQEYDYSLPDYTDTSSDNESSGVATYEPSGSKENPHIMPFYHERERLAARAYEEKPFGESFFPAATVTYSYVTVKNITAADNDTASPESKTRGGTVVTQHYTSYDFPTRTDFTTLDNPLAKRFYSNEGDVVGNLFKGLMGLKIEVNTDLTMTQGFTIETNDMNGKLKKQEVFDNGGALISSVEHKYSVTSDGGVSVLNNNVAVVDEKGIIDKKEIGVEYDLINDFRESYAYTNTHGVGVNVDFIPAGLPLVVGFGVPERAEHTQVLRMATTTKLIQRKGLLVETIAFDLGSRVTTKNLAWDPNTGQVLATETINEFDDKYYTMNYPAYWKYNYMGQATENIDLSGTMLVGNIMSGGYSECSIKNPLTGTILPNIDKYLKKGDELLINNKIVWVVDYIGTNPTKVKLMERGNGSTWDHLWEYSTNTTLSGTEVKFRVLRSGYRNQQMAPMAGITCLVNPIFDSAGNPRPNINGSTFEYPGSGTNYRVINASAVTYNEMWSTQCECDLPVMHSPTPPGPDPTAYNPYVTNTLGEWHPDGSWAYLTVREPSGEYVTRNAGFFTDFGVFYKCISTIWQDVHNTNTKWTRASTVTNYSPKGMELENMDALGRYSSAQYGHNYTLPVAVASNSRYSDMGYQGFEEDEDPDWNYIHHFGFPSNQSQFFPACVDPDPIDLVSTESHTGKRSLLVQPGEARAVCYYHNTVARDKYGCTSFSPSKGNYLISVWVKEGTATPQKTYTNAKLDVYVNSDGILDVHTYLYPTGKIVDGWQKIEGVVDFNYDPATNPGLRFNIRLINPSGVPMYFDDIRIHPVEATMKSFSYDRATQRLMAELDENNFATFYEYDLEGGLVRVKKETENGIYTIQETRSGTRKTTF